MSQHTVEEATEASEFVPVRERVGGGGGGGGGDHRGGPRGYDPKGIATAFRLLARSSGKLFSRNSSFELTEEAVRELLIGSFEALARASEQGTLLEVVTRMEAAAADERRNLLESIGNTAKVTVEETRRIVKKIIECLFPGPPR
jgi:hypothetical protein